MQQAIFPLDIMNITQDEYGDTSHQGRLAMDFVGTSSKYPYNAPFDAELIGKYPSWAGMVWRSQEKVKFANGRESFVVLRAIHECNPTYSVGDTIQQGEHMGRTGICGNVTGDHVHFEAWTGKVDDTDPDKAIHLYDLFVVPESVEIIEDKGHDWKSSPGGVELPDPIITNQYLSGDDMENNAQYIAYYLTGEGWTPEAISGMLGNMETESTINPGLWQNQDSYDDTPYIHVERQGYGLVQWTPFNKYTIWARDESEYTYDTMEGQLARILWEVENNEQWLNSRDPKGRSFQEFTQSTDSPYDLGLAFLDAYERPADPNQPIRGDQAEHWYNTLEFQAPGDIPGEPEPGPPKMENNIIKLLLSDALNGWKAF